MTHSHPNEKNEPITEQRHEALPKSPEKGGKMKDIITSVKTDALAVTGTGDKLNIHPEDVKDAADIIDRVTEYLKNSKVQEAMNFMVEQLDNPENETIYAAMKSIRSKWDALTPSTQKIATLTVPALGLLVKTGLLPVKGANREELRDTGKWIGPALKWGVVIASLKWPELKELEPFIGPFIKLLDVESEILITSYDHLQETRRKRENMPAINAPGLGSDEAPEKKKKGGKKEVTSFIEESERN